MGLNDPNQASTVVAYPLTEPLPYLLLNPTKSRLLLNLPCVVMKHHETP